VKGGGLAGDPVDVLFHGDQVIELPATRVETANTHGTGCTLSAAICARLALGDGLVHAIRAAKAYLTEGLRRSYAVGKGRGVVHHLHPLDRP
jgi:hydroxymethylpyrimidine/phosphomethylpyrimidine kinase